ncbi:hypothetical protein [Campylobacter suis]|uniref:Uncharacterized protein n=1 Tax=Campylobacter suis TaxID=2790657 RepID=A0ABN7K6U8_9BACT|nr:hypothetical protein [Campylobacter suis]CAD7288243.1 hypothetical protein LMG8286_01211 [Campylobacter suis]
MKNKKALYGMRSRQELNLSTINAVKLKILSEKMDIRISHVADIIIDEFWQNFDGITEEDINYIKELEQ